jgi:hypothetical protein
VLLLLLLKEESAASHLLHCFYFYTPLFLPFQRLHPTCYYYYYFRYIHIERVSKAVTAMKLSLAE